MKLGVVGSRKFNNYELLKSELNKFKKITLIVSGGAPGADILSEEYATAYNIPTQIFYPNYEVYGRSAPFKRNTQIVENSDFIIAFWDSKSNGTKDSINKAKRLNKPVKIIQYELVGLEMF